MTDKYTQMSQIFKNMTAYYPLLFIIIAPFLAGHLWRTHLATVPLLISRTSSFSVVPVPSKCGMELRGRDKIEGANNVSRRPIIEH